MVAALLAAGADVKATTATGTTPLMLAAASGDAEAVTLLLENGAEVNAKDTREGRDAADVRRRLNRVDAVQAAPAARRRSQATTQGDRTSLR